MTHAPPPEEDTPLPLAEESGFTHVDGRVAPTHHWITSPEGIDFLEAVFRYELENYGADYEGIDFIVLGLKGPEGLVELSPALLSRFVGYPSINSSDFRGRGVTFIIDDLRVINESTIQVEASGQGGCRWVKSYRFERQDGHWVMAKNLWTRVS